MLVKRIFQTLPSSPSLRVERDDCVRQPTDRNQGEWI